MRKNILGHRYRVAKWDFGSFSEQGNLGFRTTWKIALLHKFEQFGLAWSG